MDANATQDYGVSTWGGELYTDLVMPSDENSRVQVRRITISMLARTGMLERMDQISPTVEENVRGPAQGRPKNSSKQVGKSGAAKTGKPSDRPAKKKTKAEKEKEAQEQLTGADMQVMMDMMSILIPQIIVQPEVLPGMYVNDADEMVEVAPADRVQGAIYSDTLPLEDQMHVFSWAMEGLNMEDVKSFREEQSEGVEPVADESGVSQEAE